MKIYASHFLLRKGSTVCSCLRDRWGDIYSERGLLLPISSSGSQGCQHLHPLESRDTSDRLPVPLSTPILCTLSKSERVVLTWSPSDYTPDRPECPDAQSSSCLLIKIWQLAKAHGVTRNEPKIHVICYTTLTLTHILLGVEGVG